MNFEIAEKRNGEHYKNDEENDVENGACGNFVECIGRHFGNNEWNSQECIYGSDRKSVGDCHDESFATRFRALSKETHGKRNHWKHAWCSQSHESAAKS